LQGKHPILQVEQIPALVPVTLFLRTF